MKPGGKNQQKKSNDYVDFELYPAISQLDHFAKLASKRLGAMG